METLIFIDSFFCMAPAAVGLIVAIVLLVKSKKYRSTAPQRARNYRKAALFLILVAFVVFIVIPLVYFIYLIAKFGLTFVFSGAKSI